MAHIHDIPAGGRLCVIVLWHPGRVLDAVRTEIEQAHIAFVDWISGTAERSEEVFRRLFLDRFDRDLVLVQPAGVAVHMRDFGPGLERSHGDNPDFRIAVRDVMLLREHGELVLASYTEWQKNATRSTPRDNGRIASVWMRRDADRLRWLHVHETWLPDDVMAAGPCDF